MLEWRTYLDDRALPSIGKIGNADISEVSKYLGILQNFQNKDNGVKHKVISTYTKRL